MKAYFIATLMAVVLIGAMGRSAMGQCEGTVFGTVTVGGQACIDCKVKLLKSPSGTSLLWPTVGEVLTDQSGQYSLSIPEGADVLVMATATASFPATTPTFSGNTTKWGQAETFINSCAEVFQKDIAIVEHVPLAGNTTFRGKVYGPAGKTASDDPIPLIDVVVEKTPPGNSFGSTVTDENGEFVFDFMEADLNASYTIRINLPCVPMAGTYTINVGEDDVEFANLDFCLEDDTTSIVNCLLTSISTFPGDVINKKKPQVALHPESDAVAFTFAADQAQFALFSLTGATVVPATAIANGQLVPMAGLVPGIYIAELVFNGQVHRLRVPKL